MKENIEFIDFYRHKKQKSIILDFDRCVDFAVDYTVSLHEHADPENIKQCLKIIFERFKEDYEEVKIKY
jgi:hypothetical protein